MSNDIKETDSSDDEFYPKGSIAFFLVLIVLMMGIWFFMYFLMLSRA